MKINVDELVKKAGEELAYQCGKTLSIILGERKRIYVIVPKKLNTKPPMKVNSGYAIAQAHHATVRATRDFKLSPYETVIVLQVPDTRSLIRLSNRMAKDNVKHIIYADTVSRRKNVVHCTAIVTNELDEQPKCLRRKKLWK